MKAYYALHRFRTRELFRPWLLRIVSNEAKNRLRSARRRDALTVRAAAGGASGDAGPSPESAATRREAREALLSALAGLREQDRLVIAYRYLLELSEVETAEVLGVRPGTVKSRLSRALERLRDRLPVDLAPTDLEAADA